MHIVVLTICFIMGIFIDGNAMEGELTPQSTPALMLLNTNVDPQKDSLLWCLPKEVFTEIVIFSGFKGATALGRACKKFYHIILEGSPALNKHVLKPSICERLFQSYMKSSCPIPLEKAQELSCLKDIKSHILKYGPTPGLLDNLRYYQNLECWKTMCFLHAEGLLIAYKFSQAPDSRLHFSPSFYMEYSSLRSILSGKGELVFTQAPDDKYKIEICPAFKPYKMKVLDLCISQAQNSIKFADWLATTPNEYLADLQNVSIRLSGGNFQGIIDKLKQLPSICYLTLVNQSSEQNEEISLIAEQGEFPNLISLTLEGLKTKEFNLKSSCTLKELILLNPKQPFDLDQIFESIPVYGLRSLKINGQVYMKQLHKSQLRKSLKRAFEPSFG